MDSKKLADMINRVSEFLENEVQEGVPVVKFKDDALDFDGLKIDTNLLLQEVDGDFVLERIVEIPATKYDPGDIFYEELAITASLDDMLPLLKDAIEENQEEHDTLAWLDYENEIEEEQQEDEDDDF